MSIETIVDLQAYPLHQPDSQQWHDLVQQCRADLAAEGMYELPGFIHEEALHDIVTDLLPCMATQSYEVRRRHNIYFKDTVEGLAADHPALQKLDTVNHTLCADQLTHSTITTLYRWAPFSTFLAATMDVAVLHQMDDPLASVNVLSYRPGEALNWHFDRSVYTITLLLQGATDGGVFEYRSNLRTDLDPNYDGVAAMLSGNDPQVATVDVEPGALNVFMGRNTAHRVTTVQGDVERMIAVLSYYDRPGVRFDDSENLGFYGRTANTGATTLSAAPKM